MIHPNFYENLEEMSRRLLGTTVTYEGNPVFVGAIANHKPDGIFRLYLWPVESKERMPADTLGGYPTGDPRQGPYIDKWMEENKDTPLMRKMANSPGFNRFRPFDLGMMNSHGQAMFLERTPARRTQQGLMRQMVVQTTLSASGLPYRGPFQSELRGADFYDCVKGTHPSAEECMENMLDPNVQNTSVACHRNFAVVRGPLDTFFLGYKSDVVGFIPPAKRPAVELGKKFTHLKEVVEETRQFHDIRVRA